MILRREDYLGSELKNLRELSKNEQVKRVLKLYFKIDEDFERSECRATVAKGRQATAAFNGAWSKLTEEEKSFTSQFKSALSGSNVRLLLQERPFYQLLHVTDSETATKLKACQYQLTLRETVEFLFATRNITKGLSAIKDNSGSGEIKVTLNLQKIDEKKSSPFINALHILRILRSNGISKEKLTQMVDTEVYRLGCTLNVDLTL